MHCISCLQSAFLPMQKLAVRAKTLKKVGLKKKNAAPRAKDFTKYMVTLDNKMDSIFKARVLHHLRARHCIDNASIHDKGALAEKGISVEAGTLFEMPPRSCDIMQVIEHKHAYIEGQMTKKLEGFGQVPAVSTCQEKFREIVGQIAEKSIEKEVDRLEEVCKHIIAKGGDWADQGYN